MNRYRLLVTLGLLALPSLALAANADNDGYTTDDADPAKRDCKDDDASIHPGATDVPGDGIDQNCDGADAVSGGSTDNAAAIKAEAMKACHCCDDTPAEAERRSKAYDVAMATVGGSWDTNTCAPTSPLADGRIWWHGKYVSPGEQALAIAQRNAAGIRDIQTDLAGVKSDVQAVKADVAGVKSDVGTLTQRMDANDLGDKTRDSEIADLQGQVDGVQADQQAMAAATVGDTGTFQNPGMHGDAMSIGLTANTALATAKANAETGLVFDAWVGLHLIVDSARTVSDEDGSNKQTLRYPTAFGPEFGARVGYKFDERWELGAQAYLAPIVAEGTEFQAGERVNQSGIAFGPSLWASYLVSDQFSFGPQVGTGWHYTAVGAADSQVAGWSPVQFGGMARIDGAKPGGHTAGGLLVGFMTGPEKIGFTNTDGHEDTVGGWQSSFTVGGYLGGRPHSTLAKQ